MSEPSLSAVWASLSPRPPGDAAAFDALLAALVSRARAAAPGVTLPDAVFLAFVAERLPPDVSVEAALASMRIEDLYLACACLARDAAAVALFERQHLAVIG